MKYSDEILEMYRQEGDSLADETIRLIYESDQSQEIRSLMAQTMRNDEEISTELPSFIHDYFQKSAILPKWADTRKMKVGAKFFESNAREIMMLLGYLSLPYCYAAADGAKVLWLSERTRKDTLNRLAETGQFIFDVLEVGAFQSEGFAIRSIQKVRLIHAAIRYHILKSTDWDSSNYGLPINQEDMAGTNLAFSLVILRGLRIIGKNISVQDSEAYLHLWNVISFMMGIDEELIPDSGKEAYWLERAISKRHIQSSEEGILLTQALLKGFSDDPPIPLPKGYHESFMRFLLGNEVADMLEIPSANWTSHLIKQQKYWNAILSNFQTNYQNIRSKNIKLVKKNTVERREVDKSFQVPPKLGVDKK